MGVLTVYECSVIILIGINFIEIKFERGVIMDNKNINNNTGLTRQQKISQQSNTKQDGFKKGRKERAQSLMQTLTSFFKSPKVGKHPAIKQSSPLPPLPNKETFNTYDLKTQVELMIHEVTDRLKNSTDGKEQERLTVRLKNIEAIQGLVESGDITQLELIEGFAGDLSAREPGLSQFQKLRLTLNNSETVDMELLGTLRLQSKGMCHSIEVPLKADTPIKKISCEGVVTKDDTIVLLGSNYNNKANHNKEESIEYAIQDQIAFLNNQRAEAIKSEVLAGKVALNQGLKRLKDISTSIAKQFQPDVTIAYAIQNETTIGQTLNLMDSNLLNVDDVDLLLQQVPRSEFDGDVPKNRMESIPVFLKNPLCKEYMKTIIESQLQNNNKQLKDSLTGSPFFDVLQEDGLTLDSKSDLATDIVTNPDNYSNFWDYCSDNPVLGNTIIQLAVLNECMDCRPDLALKAKFILAYRNKHLKLTQTLNQQKNEVSEQLKKDPHNQQLEAQKNNIKKQLQEIESPTILKAIQNQNIADWVAMKDAPIETKERVYQSQVSEMNLAPSQQALVLDALIALDDVSGANEQQRRDQQQINQLIQEMGDFSKMSESQQKVHKEKETVIQTAVKMKGGFNFIKEQLPFFKEEIDATRDYKVDTKEVDNVIGGFNVDVAAKNALKMMVKWVWQASNVDTYKHRIQTLVQSQSFRAVKGGLNMDQFKIALSKTIPFDCYFEIESNVDAILAFAKSEFSSENVEFVVAMNQLIKTSKTVDQNNQKQLNDFIESAKGIYEKFCIKVGKAPNAERYKQYILNQPVGQFDKKRTEKSGSSLQINIPAPLSKSIQQLFDPDSKSNAIDSANVESVLAVLRPALEEIIRLIASDTYSRFEKKSFATNSEKYQAWLQEQQALGRQNLNYGKFWRESFLAQWLEE